MALTISLTIADQVATIALAGELEASTAPLFQAELEKAVASKPRLLVLQVQDLEYMASAGVRMFIFAKQKMGPTVDVYVVAPQETILETIRRTGLENTVIIKDKYPD